MWNYSFVFTRFFRKLRLDKTNIYNSDLLDNVKRTDFYENIDLCLNEGDEVVDCGLIIICEHEIAVGIMRKIG